MSNHQQQDFLSECMNSINIQATPEQFEASHCIICQNNLCKRSQWGDSLWIRRMNRQEHTLNNPVFLDPEDKPEYMELASQEFISIEGKQAKLYGGWVDVDAKGKVVHHAEPETQEQPSDKLDESVRSLKKPKGDTEPESQQDSGEDIINTATPEPEVLKEGVEEDVKPMETSKAPTPQKAQRKSSKTNTDAPKEGIMLGGRGSQKASTSKDRDSELIRQSQKWDAPSTDKEGGKGGKLTVRIDNGDVIDRD